MGAREKLMAFFPGSMPITAAKVADEILNEHARELAAAIREEAPSMGADEYGSYQNVLDAADMIDPNEHRR